MLGVVGRILPHLPLLLVGWLAAVLLAAPAGAAPPDPQRPGPFCTRAGCAGTTSSPAATAAAFAATAFGSALLARRRRASSG
jgi:hypothetical protein